MAIVKAGLIQCALKGDTDAELDVIKQQMIDTQIPLIEAAGAQGVNVLCFQEVFTQPYFCPSQDAKWYATTEKIPDRPTTALMQEYAKKFAMVIVVPIYEEEITGVHIGAVNRPGTEQPWNIGRFYGSSYVVDPRGEFLVEASEDQDELVVADMDMDMDVVREVRNTWQFFRDRRPETYQQIVAL